MTAVAIPIETVRAHRQARAAESRSAARARWRTRIEPLVVFVIVTVALTALGVRTTSGLHITYPDALTRLGHAYIAWWNNPPRFRAIGFTYPPLQTLVLLPFALLRPLASSLIALPLSSALLAGATTSTLDRTLKVLTLNWWLRLPLLIVFALNPLFLDYGANGSATMLEMALLALALHNFTNWYVTGATSIRSLASCGLWLAIAFLARYESILFLGVIILALPLVRLRRGASLIEVLALEAILLAPLVYIFLIWSGVSSLVGGGGFLSWITREGAQHVSGLGFDGRTTTAARASGVVMTMWRTSPMLFIVPAVLTGFSVLLRRPILLIMAGLVIVGGLASVVRMDLRPNAELLQPSYQMVALIPMLIGTAWLIALVPTDRVANGQAVRLAATAAGVIGLGVSVATAYDFMKSDYNSYDRAFHYAISSKLKRTAPAGAKPAVYGPAALHTDMQALNTFFRAAVYSRKTVLVDEQAFPGVVLAQNSTAPFRTRAENGDTFFKRFLAEPRKRGKIEYLIVANPQITVPGYPRDLISAHYPRAYSGGLPNSQIVFRDPLLAVVQLLPKKAPFASTLLPTTEQKRIQLFLNLPALSPRFPPTIRP